MKNKGILIKTYEQYEFFLLKDLSGKGKNILYYYVFNPKTGKPERKRIAKGLVGKYTDRELMRNAQDLADALIVVLSKSSYNPVTGTFSDSSLLTSSNTITECMAEFLKHRQKKFDSGVIGKSRLEGSKNIIKHFTSWLELERYQYRKPGSFTEIDLEDFLNTKAGQHKWGKETFNSYRDDIKLFFGYLVKLKVIPDNPAAGVQLKNTTHDSTMYKIYEEDELADVLEKLKNDDSYFGLLVAAKILYKYSIRLEEQLDLQISDYNREKRLLIIPPSKTKNGNEAIFSFDEDTHEILMKLIKNYPHHYYMYGNRCKPGTDRKADGFFGQKWRKFRKKYDIPEALKLYALKHTSAFFAIEGGEFISQLSQRLRHTNEKTTRRYVKNRLNKKPIMGVANSKF